MSELTQLEMTLDEASETDRLIKRHINTTRYLLLDMRDRKGWKALGYESFVEYGEKELGFASTHLYRLADSAEISLQIGFSPIGEKQPKETHLRPLTDVPESERKAIWEEATRKAEEEHAKLTAKRIEEEVAQWKAANEDAQIKLSTEQQRNAEWREQNKANRDKITALELDLSAAQNQPAPKPVVIEKEVIPEDYESAKQQASELQSQTEVLQKKLDDLNKQQAKLVSEQVKAKLQERQNELNKLEADKKAIEEIVDRKKAYLDSLSSEVKRIETHQSVINGVRLELISLAAFLNDLDPMNDQDTIKKWLALAQMNEEASKTIRWVFGDRDESNGRDLMVVV